MKEEKVSQYCSTNVVRILFSRIIFHQHENTSKWIQYCVPITDCTLPWSDLESWELEPCQIESEKCKWHPCSRGRGRAAFDISKVSTKFCGNFLNNQSRHLTISLWFRMMISPLNYDVFSTIFDEITKLWSLLYFMMISPLFHDELSTILL